MPAEYFNFLSVLLKSNMFKRSMLHCFLKQVKEKMAQMLRENPSGAGGGGLLLCCVLLFYFSLCCELGLEYLFGVICAL